MLRGFQHIPPARAGRAARKAVQRAGAAAGWSTTGLAVKHAGGAWPARRGACQAVTIIVTLGRELLL